jgi:hypothetical protein
LANTFDGRVVDERPHGVELVITREDERSFVTFLPLSSTSRTSRCMNSPRISSQVSGFQTQSHM